MGANRRQFLWAAGAIGASFVIPGLAKADAVIMEQHPLRDLFEELGATPEMLAEPRKIGVPHRYVHASLVHDHKTGQVLFEENADVPLHPASTIKPASACFYFIFEQMGLLEELNRWDRRRLEQDVRKALIVSDNDSAARIGEVLTGLDSMKDFCRRNGIAAGTQWAFGALFFDPLTRALGMNNTHIRNTSGLPGYYTKTPHNVTTLRDQAKFFDFALRRHPEILDITVEPFLDGPGSKPNTNRILETAQGPYDRGPGPMPTEGVDGLKTGYTKFAKYNLTTTALRNNDRIISQVTGRDELKDRFVDSIKLIEQGFHDLERNKKPKIKAQDNCRPADQFAHDPCPHV